VQYRDVLDDLVLQLMEHETLSRDRVLEIFSPVRKRVSRGSYTGTGKRLPSTKPPVLTPKEMALAGADGTALPAAGNGQGYGPGAEPPAIGGTGSVGGSGASMSDRKPDDGQAGRIS
jgi:cell division protease FtsH